MVRRIGEDSKIYKLGSELPPFVLYNSLYVRQLKY